MRVLAFLLVVGVTCAPAFGRDHLLGKAIPSEQSHDPWEEQTPGEIEKDAFEKEVTLDPFDLICPPFAPSASCLFNEGLATARFLEASLYVLCHLRI